MRVHWIDFFGVVIRLKDNGEKVINGAGKRSRTSDLRITNALLYQLSYTGSKER